MNLELKDQMRIKTQYVRIYDKEDFTHLPYLEDLSDKLRSMPSIVDLEDEYQELVDYLLFQISEFLSDERNIELTEDQISKLKQIGLWFDWVQQDHRITTGFHRNNSDGKTTGQIIRKLFIDYSIPKNNNKTQTNKKAKRNTQPNMPKTSVMKEDFIKNFMGEIPQELPDGSCNFNIEQYCFWVEQEYELSKKVVNAETSNGQSVFRKRCNYVLRDLILDGIITRRNKGTYTFTKPRDVKNVSSNVSYKDPFLSAVKVQ